RLVDEAVRTHGARLHAVGRRGVVVDLDLVALDRGHDDAENLLVAAARGRDAVDRPLARYRGEAALDGVRRLEARAAALLGRLGAEDARDLLLERLPRLLVGRVAAGRERLDRELERERLGQREAHGAAEVLGEADVD